MNKFEQNKAERMMLNRNASYNRRKGMQYGCNMMKEAPTIVVHNFLFSAFIFGTCMSLFLLLILVYRVKKEHKFFLQNMYRYKTLAFQKAKSFNLVFFATKIQAWL